MIKRSTAESMERPPAKRATQKTTDPDDWIYAAPVSAEEYIWEDAARATAHLFTEDIIPFEIATLHLRIEEGAGFTPEEHEAFNEVIDGFTDIFKESGPPTPYIEHAIDTGTQAPIAEPPYRLTPQKKEFLKKEIQTMLDDHIVEECDSPWAAPEVNKGRS